MRAFRFKDWAGAYRSISAALLLSPLAVGVSAAQSIPHCYVDTAPCGSPDALYQRIMHCVDDASFCEKLSGRNGSQVRLDDSSDGSHAATVPASVASVPTTQSGDRRHAVDHSVPLQTLSREGAVQDGRGGLPGDAKLLDIDVAAKNLPIDDSVGSLRA